MFLIDSFIEDLRKAFACLCCLLCFGPLLMIIGIWQFASAPGATSNRNNMIAKVNTQIDTWATVEPQFAASKWIVNTQPMTLSTTSDVPTVEGLKSYTGAKFYSTSSAVIQASRFNSAATAAIVLASTTNSTTFTVSVRPFATVTTTNNDRSNCENNQQGTYLNGQCTTYYVMNDFCVKVARSNGPYSPNNEYGGEGCYYSNDLPAAAIPSSIGTGWTPANYHKVAYDDDKIYFFNSFTVRDAADPYIAYQSVNSGSASWPLSTGQKLMVGTVLMVIGGIFMLPCIGFVVVFAICFRRRKHREGGLLEGGRHHHHHSGY